MSSYNQSETAIVSIDTEQRLQNLATYFNLAATKRRYRSTEFPVAILWDIENCSVPNDIRPEDVASNIRLAVQLHPVITGSSVVIFSAFGDFNAFPRRVREGCQRTGVKLVDVPNGRKDAADMAILLDMFLFVLDNPPPATIILISGDVDFAPALHVLGQRGYTIVVVIPSGVYVNSALTSAGKFVWDWLSIVHGQGFVPAVQPVPRYLMGCNEEETILYMPQKCCSSSSPPPPPPPPVHQLESTMWIAPGDFNGLKGQLVKVLELAGGFIPVARVPVEYQRNFGKPLFVGDYGASNLLNLFKKMSDVIAVDGKGNKRFVYLKNSKPNNVVASSTPVVLLRREKNGKETSNGLLEEFKLELQEIMVCYCCRVQMDCFEAIYKQRYKKTLDYKEMGIDHLDQLFDKVGDLVAVYEDPTTGIKLVNAL